MADISDRLEVRIVNADDLPLVEGLLPSSFTEVVVGTDVKRTSMIMENKNPQWDSDPMIFSDLIMQSIDALLIYVKHVDASGSEMPMGVIVIPTDTPFNSPRMELDGWYDLKATTGMPSNEQGEVYVKGRVRIRMVRRVGGRLVRGYVRF